MIFEVYQDKAKEWRWRLVSIRNKKIVADSGEGYHSKSNVLRAVRRLNQLFSVELKINQL